MIIEIFDVELGQCVMIHCPNGQKIMIDAGHNVSRPWYPSVHFRGQNIEQLVISNYDEDHASDFVDLRQKCNIRTINRNNTVSSAALLSMKTPLGMGNGINALYQWMKEVEGPAGVVLQPADLAGVELKYYRNPYGAFTDTNNLSLVTFVNYGNFTVLFPSDLEIAGWKALLKSPDFRSQLAKVTVFVASHHGRENGCCVEVFNYCSPKAIIISDDGKQHATQETCNWYSNRVTGCKTIGRTDRKVLTTRNDGHITIEVESNMNSNQSWYIATENEKAALKSA